MAIPAGLQLITEAGGISCSQININGREPPRRIMNWPSMNISENNFSISSAISLKSRI